MSAVPRTRVYEAVDELHEFGLIHVQESIPKPYRPISAETSRRHIKLDHSHRVGELTATLSVPEL